MAGIRSRADGWFTLTRKFTFKGIFAWIDRPVNALNFVTDSIHTNKLVADFLQVNGNFKQKTAVLRF